MELVKDYWYLILLGLIAVMFIFGHRTKGNTETNVSDDNRHGAHTDEEAHKSGHSCCH